MPVDQKQAAPCCLSMHASSAFRFSKYGMLACDEEVEAHKDTSQHVQPNPHVAKAPDLESATNPMSRILGAGGHEPTTKICASALKGNLIIAAQETRLGGQKAKDLQYNDRYGQFNFEMRVA